MRAAIIALSLGLAGCGGTGENIDQLGCDALPGAATPITAGTALDASAPAITAGTAFAVTLPASGAGYLAFDSLDDTDYAMFLDRDVTFAVFDDAGAPVMLAASGSSSTVCTTIHGRHIFELPVGPAYLAFGPDAGGPVRVDLEVYNPD